SIAPPRSRQASCGISWTGPVKAAELGAREANVPLGRGQTAIATDPSSYRGWIDMHELGGAGHAHDAGAVMGRMEAEHGPRGDAHPRARHGAGNQRAG